MNKQKIVGNLAILTAITFFALNFSAIKYMLPRWLDPNSLTAIRMFGGAVLFWIASLFIKYERIDKKDWLTILGGGFLGILCFQFFFAASLAKTSPIDGAIIITLTPVIVLIISAIAFKESITIRKVIGIVLGLIGALLIILSNSKAASIPGRMSGNLLMFASAVLYAFYLIITKKVATKYSSVSILKWMFLISAVGSIPLWILGYPGASLFHETFTFTPIWVLCFIVLLPTFISYLLIPVSLKRIKPTTASMYNYALPLIASIVSIFLKQDTLTWEQPIAAALIFVGVYFVTSSKSKPIAGNK